MDMLTGKIILPEEFQRMLAKTDAWMEGNLTKALKRLEKNKNIMEMKIPPTERQLKEGKVRRNDPCPCGSGKKFKKCCWINNRSV